MTTLTRLIAQMEPRLQSAFLAAIEDLKQGVDKDALIAALDIGDIAGAVAALNITRAAFERYRLQRANDYLDAGTRLALAIQELPDAPIYRFDPSEDVEDVTFGSEYPSDGAGGTVGVGYYSDEQNEFFFGWFAFMLSLGYTATQIMARTTPMIGLSRTQGEYVDHMRERLLSGDPEEMAKVIGRFDAKGRWVEGTGMTLRDRRFDALIKKAIAEGKPIPTAKVEEMAKVYSKRLLERRAKWIAETEASQIAAAANFAATAQSMRKKGVSDDAVKKTWRHSLILKHARKDHVAMNGVSVLGLRTPFVLPDGTMMQHDHDPAGGVKNNANCRCSTVYDINFRRV